MRRLFVLVLVVVLVGIPKGAFAKEQCFVDKVAFCFVHPFAPYWELNGALPVFGYPITIAQNEANADSGQSFLTQWAERNRLEYHPENKGTPYEVLLGLLGKERLAQLGRDYAAEPRESGPKDGCLWFEQTGHNVCNITGSLGFKTYWETHGLKIPGMSKFDQSLQLFGLPLTEPKEETNAAGATVMTQWFERARFEWHPNNPDEFKVLLGLLGQELRTNTIFPRPVNPSDPCNDIPEPISGSVTPGKCVKIGGRMQVSVVGFAANESITMWDVSETGELTVVPNAVTTDGNGSLHIDIPVNMDLGLGFWQWSFEGVTSKHQATIYFRVLPGDPPPPPPPPPSVPASCNRSAGPGAPQTPIRIVGLNKSAETVTIRNVSGQTVDVSGWWICSMTGNQLHAKLSGTIAAGQTITVQSQAGNNIWNNSNNDDAALFNAQGELISFWDD